MMENDQDEEEDNTLSNGCLIGGTVAFFGRLSISKDIIEAAKAAIVGCTVGKWIEDAANTSQSTPKAPPLINIPQNQTHTPTIM